VPMTMRVRVSGYFILGFSIVAFLAVGFVIVGFYVAVNCTPYMQDTFAMLKRKQNSLIQIRVITVPFVTMDRSCVVFEIKRGTVENRSYFHTVPRSRTLGKTVATMLALFLWHLLQTEPDA